MVGGDDDERVIISPHLLEMAEQPGHLLIHVGDSAIVLRGQMLFLVVGDVAPESKHVGLKIVLLLGRDSVVLAWIHRVKRSGRDQRPMCIHIVEK